MGKNAALPEGTATRRSPRGRGDFHSNRCRRHWRPFFAGRSGGCSL